LKSIDGQILLSASDLMRFTGCAHATTLDLSYVRSRQPEPRADSEDAELLQQRGNDHEAAYLDQLKRSGRQVVALQPGSLADDAERTRVALAAGTEVISQGAFLSAYWSGWADFLERVETPSKLGSFSYEVADTKLKRTPHPRHVLQLVLYSDLLAEVQGVVPENAHVQLGNGERWTFRVADYADYARLTRRRLEDFVADPPRTRPEPCADCGLCRWGDYCQTTWEDSDSLFNVAGITRGQVKKLEAAGIATMAGLARRRSRVPGMAPATLDRLHAQARLQDARKLGRPTHELRAPEPGRGFDLLPQPRPGDIFYDIEGDPHHENGLEYLHGVWTEGRFQSFWAHDHDAEKVAVTALLAHFRDRLDAYPHARIYHYAPYEITALRRLTARYGVGESFLDRLLRERRFVDLYAVVRGAIIASEPDYSLKSLEALYDFERTGAVQTAGGSIVAYERWRNNGDQAILDEIEAYNRLDCMSTEALRDWLVGVRPPAMPWPVLERDASEKAVDDDADEAALRGLLARSSLPAERQQMLFDLGRFHRREIKPGWWAVFDSMGKDRDELIDDLSALGGLAATGSGYKVKQSIARDYRFPAQETKLRAGGAATVQTDEGPETVNVETLDTDACTVTLKVGAKRADLLADRLDLHPGKPFDTRKVGEAVANVIADQCGKQVYRAVGDLIAAAPPRLSGSKGHILAGSDLVEGTIAAVHRMKGTVLPVQGPPGTGKTYVTARAILSLVAAGHRVGVTSNSHEAIRNVMLACVAALGGSDAPDMVHKVSGDDDFYAEGFPVRATTDNADAADGHDIVGGTVFFFSRDDNVQAFDWLFVDEAGQVSLANMGGDGPGCAEHRPGRRPAAVAPGDPGRTPESGESLLPPVDAGRRGDRPARARHPPRRHPADASRPLPFRLAALLRGRVDQHPRRRPPGGDPDALSDRGRLLGPGRARGQCPGRGRGDRRDRRGHRPPAPWPMDRSGRQDARHAAVRHHRRRAVQRAGQRAPRGARPDDPGRHGGQVPGPGSARLPRLDDRVVGRRHTARHGFPVLGEPAQRRHLAGEGAGAGLRQPAAPRGPVRDGRADGARQHALRPAGVGHSGSQAIEGRGPERQRAEASPPPPLP
jgi:predicted RecB family nuclease